MAPYATEKQTADATDLDELEAHYSGQYNCSRCFDWKTIVEDGVSIPCSRCQPDRWKSALLAHFPGMAVSVTAVESLCVTVRPCDVGLRGETPVEACEDVNRCPMVFVRSLDGGDPWWISVKDVEVWAKGAEA